VILIIFKQVIKIISPTLFLLGTINYNHIIKQLKIIKKWILNPEHNLFKFKHKNQNNKSLKTQRKMRKLYNKLQIRQIKRFFKRYIKIHNRNQMEI